MSLERMRQNRFVALVLNNLQTPLLRNAYALLINTGASAGFGFLFWIAAARLYPREVVGINSAAISTMMLLASLSQLNLNSALNRFIPTLGGRAPRFVLSAYAVTALLAAVTATLFLFGQAALSQQVRFLELGNGFAIWFVLATMIWVVFALQDATLIGLRAAIWVPVENSVFGLAKLIFIVLLFFLLPDTALFVAWTLPVVFLILPINWLIFARLMPKHAKMAPTQTITLGGISRYVTADYVGQLLYLGSSSLLPLIIIEQLGPATNAYFQIAWSIALTAALMSDSMTQSLTVEGANDPEQLRHFVVKIARQLSFILLPLVAILVIGAPYILLLFGRDYSTEGAVVLQLLSLAALPLAVINVTQSIARVLRRMHLVIIMAGMSCVLSLSLTYFLSIDYGLFGVGLGYLISQVIVALVVPPILLFAVFRAAPTPTRPA